MICLLLNYFNGYYEYDAQKEAIKVWNRSIEEAEKHVLPELTYTGEEASEAANIEARGKQNLTAAISNIMLGKASMDTYDAAIAACKKAGYDRLVEIKQAAYDRYLKVVR